MVVREERLAVAQPDPPSWVAPMRIDQQSGDEEVLSGAEFLGHRSFLFEVRSRSGWR